MSSRQVALCISIVLFFLGVIIFTQYYYGPSRRVSVSPPRVDLVVSSKQLGQVWQNSGVKGRTLVTYTRYLNAKETKESTDIDVTERAMGKGVIRRVFHVVPDHAWNEVSKNLSGRKGMRPTQEGYIGVFEYGRVYIMPLSRFSPPSEKSLLVVEPKIWTVAEQAKIIANLTSGQLTADLVAIIRGTDQDAVNFRMLMRVR